VRDWWPPQRVSQGGGGASQYSERQTQRKPWYQSRPILMTPEWGGSSLSAGKRLLADRHPPLGSGYHTKKFMGTTQKNLKNLRQITFLKPPRLHPHFCFKIRCGNNQFCDDDDDNDKWRDKERAWLVAGNWRSQKPERQLWADMFPPPKTQNQHRHFNFLVSK